MILRILVYSEHRKTKYIDVEFKLQFFKAQTIGLYLLRINLPLYSTVVPSSIFMFLSCRPFVVITTLSTGFVGVEVTSVSWLRQLTVGV